VVTEVARLRQGGALTLEDMLGWVLAVAACVALALGAAVWIGAFARGPSVRVRSTSKVESSMPCMPSAGSPPGLAILQRPGDATELVCLVRSRTGPRRSSPWLLLAGALGFVARRVWSRRNLGPLGVRRDSGLARPKDLAGLVVSEPTEGRLTLGTVGRRMIAAEPQTSLAVVGPTGCGKTIGFAIPNLLEWNGPVIATSVKGDLLDATIAARAKRGKVWIYDPTAITGHPVDGWSPLAVCREWSGAMRVAAWLCEAAQPRVDSVNDGDYWYTQARKALAPHLHAAAIGNRTIADVVRWIDTQEREQVRELLERGAGVEDTIESMLAGPDADGWRAQLRDEVEEAEIASYAEVLQRVEIPVPGISCRTTCPTGRSSTLSACRIGLMPRWTRSSAHSFARPSSEMRERQGCSIR
jgi:hypothetical protein